MLLLFCNLIRTLYLTLLTRHFLAVQEGLGERQEFGGGGGGGGGRGGGEGAINYFSVKVAVI